MNFEKSKEFIYRNARSLDFLRWKYHFEGGSKEDVISALAAYQNHDGGFAHALEADCLNENSSPLQTWVATRIIAEIDLKDRDHPLIVGILNYLDSKHEFNGHLWHGLKTVKSNNDYPHAPWWSYTSEIESHYNPTASLLGFIMKYAEKESDLYKLGTQLLGEAFHYLESNCPLESMHESACFVELYEYLQSLETFDIIDLKAFKGLIIKQMNSVLSFEIDTWASDYVCKPSLFIKSKESDFYSEYRELCDFEVFFISQTQKEDGTWSINWAWNDYLEEWQISQHWWKSDMIIKNCLFYQNFR